MLVVDASAIVDLVLEHPLTLMTSDAKLGRAHGHTATIESYAR